MEAFLNKFRAVKELNCVKDVRFPISYSIQSLDLIPTEAEPGFASITLKQCGQIRVVHGDADLWQAVGEVFPLEDGEQKGSTNVRTSVWIRDTEEGMFDSERGLQVTRGQ